MCNLNFFKKFCIFIKYKVTHKNRDCNWKEKFEYLDLFKENYGHTNVPQRCEYNSGLGAWVAKQRNYFFRYKISENRIKLLRNLKFNWAPGKFFAFGIFWIRKYKELKIFKNFYGHCNVPSKYIENRELGFWVKNQRQFFKKGIVESGRIFLLSEIGFEWMRRISFVKMTWNQRFRELEIYINKYGNSLVPQRSGSLGKWVQTQRNLYKKNSIKEEKVNLLNGVKFIWKPKEFFLKKKLVLLVKNQLH